MLSHVKKRQLDSSFKKNVFIHKNMSTEVPIGQESTLMSIFLRFIFIFILLIKVKHFILHLILLFSTFHSFIIAGSDNVSFVIPLDYVLNIKWPYSLCVLCIMGHLIRYSPSFPNLPSHNNGMCCSEFTTCHVSIIHPLSIICSIVCIS